MNALRSLTFAALAAALFAAPARAEDIKAGDLVISQAWSRATPNGAKIAGGYLTIENKGTAPDRLIGGSGDIAGKVEVHEMAMNNGVMTMRPLDKGLAIEPGKTVKLAPGGYHLMILDLKGPFKQGEKVPVTLEFEKAGKVNAVARRAGRRRAGARRRRSFGRSHGDEEVRTRKKRLFRHRRRHARRVAGLCAVGWTEAGHRRFVLQGGVRGAAWLRGIGDDQDPRANSGRGDRRQADAEGRLEGRGDQRQVRRRV